ncbi:MAG: zf-HC2 domain-containing protein [Thermodesulfobacteriota bacterium]
MDKMNCEKCSELLLEYMDGELSSEETALVRSHIEACPECLREYEDYAEIRRTASEHAAGPRAIARNRIRPRARREGERLEGP